MNPQRGEVWWVDLGMAAKVRPAIVVSASIADADYALISIVPHTTSGRGANFEIDLPVRGLKAGVFNVQALQPVSCHRFERHIGGLSTDQMKSLDDTIRKWLAL